MYTITHRSDADAAGRQGRRTSKRAPGEGARPAGGITSGGNVVKKRSS